MQPLNTRDNEKQEKALALSERQGGDFCPQCGQLQGERLALFRRTPKLNDADTCKNRWKRRRWQLSHDADRK